MREAASPDDLERLTANVRDELRAQNALRGLGLSDDVLDGLASAIAVNVDHAFDVRWSPNWVKGGEPHAWQDANGAFVECVACRIVFGPETDAATARRRFDEHRMARHADP